MPHPDFRTNPRFYFLWFCLVLFSTSLWAKDYKGLFGSYRKDKFTENEGLSTAFGMNFNLGTLFPISTVVSSDEGFNSSGERIGGKLSYATSFNVELEPYLTLMYRWQIFGRIGYASYETRKENSVFTDTTNNLPLFHEFDMQIVPALLGVRYRFSQSDLVPYISLAGGIVYTQRKASYDYSPLQQRQFLTAFAADVGLGMQFFFAARAGIRVEVSGFFMKLPSNTFNPTGAVPTQNPAIIMASNPWTVRYASGIFVIF